MMYWIKKYFSNRETHVQSIYEVGLVVIFSVAPFIMTYFIRMSHAAEGSVVGINDLISKGQLYLLAYSVFGTILWLAFAKSDKPRHGARIFLGIFGVFLMLPVIGLLGVDPTFSANLSSFSITLSYWMYGIFIFVHYLLLFYMEIPPPQPRDILNREAQEMRALYTEMNKNG